MTGGSKEDLESIKPRLEYIKRLHDEKTDIADLITLKKQNPRWNSKTIKRLTKKLEEIDTKILNTGPIEQQKAAYQNKWSNFLTNELKRLLEDKKNITILLGDTQQERTMKSRFKRTMAKHLDFIQEVNLVDQLKKDRNTVNVFIEKLDLSAYTTEGILRNLPELIVELCSGIYQDTQRLRAFINEKDGKFQLKMKMALNVREDHPSDQTVIRRQASQGREYRIESKEKQAEIRKYSTSTPSITEDEEEEEEDE